MSETATSAAAPTSATETTTATPAAAPPAAAAAKTETPKEEPMWLGERISRAQKQLLREAGVKVGKNDNPADVIKAIRDKSSSRKEQLVAALKANADLSEQNLVLQSKAAVVDVAAKAELETLDEKTRAAIKVVAGEDPQKILETISLFKMTGRTASAEPAKAAEPAATQAPPVVQAPASTSPVTTTPAPASPSDVDVKQQYANISNPYARAAFILSHPELVPGLLT